MAGPDATLSSIVVTLNGGLGNQLFQYAMGRALSLREGVPLVLDLAWFGLVKGQDGAVTTIRNYALEPFELEVGTQCIGLPQPKAAGLMGRVLRRVFRYVPRQHFGRKVYFERGFAFEPTAFSLQGPVWLEGYWQSHRYFNDYAEVLRSELGRPRKVGAATLEMLGKIGDCDAICLHIRRGDYVTNKYAAATHGLCSLDYYAKGLDVVLPGLPYPRCFVFSDDPEWAKDNLRLPVPMTIVDINGPASAHEDLWLMSACNRFIIANSSLSWWGAWLSESAGKMVVAPRQWFVDSSKDTSDLIPAEWVRV
jgi:hypothetical protein